MKTFTLTALTFALFSGSALAGDRNEIDTDLIYGSQPVVAQMGAPAEREIGGRQNINSDIVFGGASVASSIGSAAVTNVTERSDLSTDILYGV